VATVLAAMAITMASVAMKSVATAAVEADQSPAIAAMAMTLM